MRTARALTADNFYQHPFWRKTRKAFYQQNDGLCAFCKTQGIFVAGNTLDHKIPLNFPQDLENWDKMFGFENLQSLCRSCHDHKSGRAAKVIKKGWAFDSAGNIVKDNKPKIITDKEIRKQYETTKNSKKTK